LSGQFHLVDHQGLALLHEDGSFHCFRQHGRRLSYSK
jgi:hypothetical protein